MVLNNYSHVHKKIRFLCIYLETATGLKLQTDLSSDFSSIDFMNELSYLRIYWNKSIYVTLNCKLSKEQASAVESIITYLDWLETGLSITKVVKRRPLK